MLGKCFQHLPASEGFILSARLKSGGEDTDLLRDVADQDFIHNFKKLISHQDHSSIVLKMGTYTVHINQIQLVYDSFAISEHLLASDDVLQHDRQNYYYGPKQC